MIPGDREELHALAGEYVLGVLDAQGAREIASALVTNAELRRAVAFWEEKLHPLSALAAPAEPPPGTWEAIAARLAPPRPAALRWWTKPAPWRWSTGGLAAAAAALLFYVAVAPPLRTPPAPAAAPLVALLRAPEQERAGFVATAGRDGLALRAVARESPPDRHVFELWVIAPRATRPEPLGVIPANGTLRLAALTPAIRDGATLAISAEPPGGSPTGQPTGPIAFVGELEAL